MLRTLAFCCMFFSFFLNRAGAEVYKDKHVETNGGQAEGSELIRFGDFKASDLKSSK